MEIQRRYKLAPPKQQALSIGLDLGVTHVTVKRASAGLKPVLTTQSNKAAYGQNVYSTKLARELGFGKCTYSPQRSLQDLLEKQDMPGRSCRWSVTVWNISVRRLRSDRALRHISRLKRVPHTRRQLQESLTFAVHAGRFPVFIPR